MIFVSVHLVCAGLPDGWQPLRFFVPWDTCWTRWMLKPQDPLETRSDTNTQH